MTPLAAAVSPQTRRLFLGLKSPLLPCPHPEVATFAGLAIFSVSSQRCLFRRLHACCYIHSDPYLPGMPWLFWAHWDNLAPSLTSRSSTESGGWRGWLSLFCISLRRGVQSLEPTVMWHGGLYPQVLGFKQKQAGSLRLSHTHREAHAHTRLAAALKKISEVSPWLPHTHAYAPQVMQAHTDRNVHTKILY